MKVFFVKSISRKFSWQWFYGKFRQKFLVLILSRSLLQWGVGQRKKHTLFLNTHFYFFLHKFSIFFSDLCEIQFQSGGLQSPSKVPHFGKSLNISKKKSLIKAGHLKKLNLKKKLPMSKAECLAVSISFSISKTLFCTSSDSCSRHRIPISKMFISSTYSFKTFYKNRNIILIKAYIKMN